MTRILVKCSVPLITQSELNMYFRLSFIEYLLCARCSWKQKEENVQELTCLLSVSVELICDTFLVRG